MTPENNLPLDSRAETEFIPEDTAAAVSTDTKPSRIPASIRKLWKEKKYLLICFFLPAMLMWMIYISMKSMRNPSRSS